MNGTWWVNPSQLDDDQRNIVQLGSDGKYLILGPPGSGKTNLLILRANYLYLAGRPNVLILVFTRTLREFLASGALKYNFPESKIQTYNSWAKTTLRDNGIQHISIDDFERERNNILEHLTKMTTTWGISNLYDSIFLDEVHDYDPREIDIFFKLSANIFAVGDPRQRIYKTQGSIEHLKTLVDDTKYLKYHYRNGLAICRLADNLTKSALEEDLLTPTSNYNEVEFPSRVQCYKTKTLEEQFEQLLNDLTTQLIAYPDEFIGIVCPRHQELAKVRTYLENSALSNKCTFQAPNGGCVTFKPEYPICITTLHSAKGLEFRALHILAANTLSGFPNNRNLVFTGITRAKTSLSIYYSGDLPGYLESAVQSLSPRKDPPSINEVFGMEK